MKSKHDIRIFKNDLIDLMGDSLPVGAENEIFRDMLYNIGKLRDEKLDILELRLLNTAFAELRYALSVFKPYRQTPKAAVFGRKGRDFGRDVASRLRRYVAGKFFRCGPARLWMTAAAVQRLAF